MVFPDAAGVGLCDAIGNLTWKDGKSYQYTSGKPHAATAWGSSVTLRYDANGNVTQRTVGGRRMRTRTTRRTG